MLPRCICSIFCCFICKQGDLISIREKVQSKTLLQGNFETQQQKRKLIQRRMTRVNLTKSRFQSLLPSHLEVNNEKFPFMFIILPILIYFQCLYTTWLFEHHLPIHCQHQKPSLNSPVYY